MIARRTEVFDTEKNYWTIFPEMKQHAAFSHYYKEDKSKKKTSSSNIMWAFHLVCHPKSLMYYDPHKLDNVKGLLPASMKTLESQETELELYKQLMLTEAQKALADWEDMIKKRSKYLKEQNYTLDNGKDLDTLHKNTYAIFKDYQKVCEELKVEEDSNNGALSLSESGEI